MPQQVRFSFTIRAAVRRLAFTSQYLTYSALRRYPTSNKSSYITSPSSRKKEAHFAPFLLSSLTQRLTSERVPAHRPLSVGKTAIRCRKLCSSLETTYFSGGGAVAVATAVSILRDENDAGSVKLKQKDLRRTDGRTDSGLCLPPFLLWRVGETL